MARFFQPDHMYICIYIHIYTYIHTCIIYIIYITHVARARNKYGMIIIIKVIKNGIMVIIIVTIGNDITIIQK